jgi:hypothetical protein
MQGPDYPTETILHYTTVPLKLGFGAADEVGYEAKPQGDRASRQDTRNY